jgi:2'-5' RNA ligase
MENSRKQLTLFVQPLAAEIIESIREKFNPVQSELIKSHVTLCREDEIENIDGIIRNLSQLVHSKVSIELGEIQRFSNGKGVLLSGIDKYKEFENLRKIVLNGIVSNPRLQQPHVTLMHPRNSTCTDEIFLQIKQFDFPACLEFDRVSLIEQNSGGKWKVLEEFDLIRT